MFLKEFWELPDDQKDEVIRRWSHSKQIRQEMALVKKLQADLDIKIINLRLECKHYSVQGIHLFEEETGRGYTEFYCPDCEAVWREEQEND